jgi:hypothetical protein
MKSIINQNKAWQCPGGISAPINCISSEHIQSLDGSSCVCKPGYYTGEGNTCIQCDPGYFCTDGVKTQCPIHYYQPSHGASACLQCGSSGTSTGFYRDCRVRGQQLQFCDPSVPGSQTRQLQEQCIPCNQCRRVYVQELEGQLSNCYRDN